MLQSTGPVPLPTDADIHKIVAQLRDDMTTEVCTEVADRLLQLAASEPHPMLKSALLERAGRLVAGHDAGRGMHLLREAFRLYPTAIGGSRLHALALNDPAFLRLNRLGHLSDAVAEVADSPAARAAALLDAARSHLDQGHGIAAEAALHKLLDLHPDHADAREWLDIAKAQQEARTEALMAQRLEIGTCPDEDRPRTLLAYAELLLAGEEPLADAAAVVADAVDNGASLADAAPLWVEVARAMGDPHELTRALAASLAAGDALPTRLQHADELANIPGVDRASPEAAQVALAVLGEALPDDVTIRARLDTTRALLAGDGAEAALDAIRLRSLQARDRVGESVACLALAQLAQAQGGDPEKAERHFRRVRTLTPQNPEALDFFENLYRSQGDHKRLLVALSQRLATSEARDVVRIGTEMAQLAEGPLATPERAMEAWQRVVAVQPDHALATAALDRLYQQMGRWHALRDLLDRRARGLLGRATVDPAAAQQAVATLLRIVALHDTDGPLTHADSALAAHVQILQAAPRHAEALAAVAAAAEASGDWNSLAQALERACLTATEPADVAQHASRLAELWQPHDAEIAAEWGQRSLEARPDDPALARRLQETWRALGDDARLQAALVAELAATWGESPLAMEPDGLAKLVDGADAEARLRVVAVLEEAAALAEAAESPADALKLYRLLLEAGPGHAGAAAGLERLAVDRQDVLADLAAVLEAQAAGAGLSESQRISVWERLTSLLAGPLQDMARAEQAAGSLRALDPDSAIAQAVGARALLGKGDLAALRAIYPAGRHGALAFVEAALAKDHAPGSDVAQTIQGILAVSQVLVDELADPERAAFVLAEALAQAEGHGDAGLVLVVGQTLLRRAQDAGLVGLQRLAVEALIAHAPADRVATYKQLLVDLCATAEQWPDAAAGAAELVEERLISEQWAVLPDAVAQWASLAERANEAAAVPYRLAGWAELVGDAEPSVAGALWRQAAETATGVDVDLARRAVDAALACLDPAAGVAAAATVVALLELKERICSEQGDWSEALAALEALAAAREGSDRASSLLRAADLADVSLDSPAHALKLYQQVAALLPESYEAWSGIASTARRVEGVAALTEALDRLLVLPEAGRDARARAALERVGLAVDAQEAEPLRPAMGVLDQLHTRASLLEPETTLLQVALAQLDLPERARATAQMLLPALRQHHLDEDALRCLDVLATTEPASSGLAVQWRVMQADLVERDDPNRAWAAVRAALVAEPATLTAPAGNTGAAPAGNTGASAAENTGNDATLLAAGLDRLSLVERAVRLAGRTGHDADLDAVLLALVGETELPGVRAVQDATLRMRLATLRAERAMHSGDVATAAGLFTLLHSLAPSDVVPLDALEALYREANDFDAVAFVLEERLQAGAGDEDRLATFLRLASLQADERDTAAEAEEVLARAVAAYPDSVEAWTLWLSVLRDGLHAGREGGADRQKLAIALQKRLEVLGAADSNEATSERHAVRLEVADLLDAPGEDRSEALRMWVAALEVDPGDNNAAVRATEALLALCGQVGTPVGLQDVADRLEGVLEARGDWPSLDAILSARLGGTQDQVRKGLLERQAFIRERGRIDPEGAFTVLAEALCLAPEDNHLLAEVCRLASGGTPKHPGPMRAGKALAAAALACKSLEKRRTLRLQALTYLEGEGDLRVETRGVFEAMLADFPGDPDALAGLDQLTQQTGDDRGRLAVLAARAKSAPTKAEQSELGLERARLAERLGDDALAVSCYRDLLGPDSGDAKREAAASLCALHERRGEQRELADSLMVLRGTVQDSEGRLALSLRAAAVLSQYGDLERARHLLRGEEVEDPRNTDIYHAVKDLLAIGGDRTALAEHLHRGFADVFAGDRDPAGREQLASAWVQALADLGKPAAAQLEALDEVLAAGLASPEIEAHLARLAEGEDAAAFAAGQRRLAMVQGRHDAEGEVALRLDLLNRFEAELDPTDERKAIAQLFEIGLQDQEAALSQWQVLLASAPWDAAIASEAQRLGDALGQGADVDEWVVDAALRIEDRATRNAVRMRLVDRAYTRDDMGRMAELLDGVLTDDPTHADAYSLRGAVLTELPAWHNSERLAAHWRHGIAHSADAAVRRTARERLAAMLHGHLGLSGDAFDVLRAQVEEDHAGGVATEATDAALADAEKYGDAAGRTAEVRALIATAIEHTPAGPARAPRWAALAARSLEHDKNPQAARMFAERALDESGDEPLPRALAVLDAAADHLETLDPLLTLRLADGLGATQPARAVALLQRAAATAGPADEPALRERIGLLAAAARAAGADLDDVRIRLDLARAAPGNTERWDAAEASAGASRAGEVVAVLMQLAETTQELRLRHDLLLRAARLAEVDDDLDTAGATVRLALEAEDRPTTRSLLHGLLERQGRHEELALELEAEADSAPQRAPHLLSRAAALWLGPLNDPGRGVGVLDRLVAQNPTETALADQRLAALQATDDPRFLPELQRLVAATRAGEDPLRHARWLAVLIGETRNSDDGRATFVLVQELAVVQPERFATVGVSPLPDTAATAALEDTLAWLQARLGDLEPAAARELLRWRLQGIDPQADGQEWAATRLAGLDLAATAAERRALWLDVGYHARDRMHDPATALEWLLQAAVADAEGPVPTDLLRDIAALVDAAPAAHSTLSALEPLLAAGPQSSAAVAVTGFDLGCQWLGDSDVLAPFAKAAAEGDPPRLDAAIWYEGHLQARGDDAGLADALAARATRQAVSEPEAAVDAWLQLAEVARERLNDAPRAAKALDAALAVLPEHEGALRSRLQIAVDAEDAQAIADLTERVAVTADPAETVALYAQRGAALETLGRDTEALEAYDLALLGDETHGTALVRRAALLGQLGRADEARRALLQVAKAIGDAGAMPMLLQAAAMAQTAGDLDGALGLYERAIAAVPADPALWQALDARRSDAAFVQAAAAQLANILREHGLIERLVNLQVAALDHVPAADRAVATRTLALTLARDLGDAPRAVDLLLNLARTEADPLEVLSDAADLARDGQVLETWIDGVADLVSGEELPADAVVPVIALAAAAALECGDSLRAADLWQLAWDQDPDSADAREGVLALRREAGDPHRLASDLERALMLGDESDRTALRLELAELKKNVLGRPRDAVRLVFEVLVSQPDHAGARTLAEQLARNPVCGEEATAQLEQVYRNTSDYQGLASVLQLRLDRATSPSVRGDLARRLADLQTQLRAGQGALKSLLVALEAEPQPATLASIERAADPIADAAVLSRAYEVVLSGTLPSEERFQILARAMKFDQARGDQVQAERRLRAMCDLKPHAPEPFEALEGLLDASGRWDELIALWRRRLGATTDPDQRRLALYRIAGIARATGQATAALEAYAELCQLDPTDADPFAARVELLREADAQAALAEALVGLARATANRHDRSVFLCESARLQGRNLHHAEKAADLYAEAFEADPGQDEAFVYLERHIGHESRKLQALYDKRAGGLPAGPGRTLILRRLAAACGELDDGAGACAALKRALADDAGNSAVLDELLRIAETHKQWHAYAEAAERKLATEPRRETQVALHAQLARIALTEEPNPALAKVHVEALQALAPREPVTRHVLALMQAHSGDPQEVAAGLEQMVKEADDPATQVSLHQQLADLYAGPLDNPTKAIREFQRLIQLDPTRWGARRKLCDLYAARISPEAHAESLRQWIAAHTEGGNRHTLQMAQGEIIVALTQELGEVLLQLGQTTEATHLLRRAQALGGHGERIDGLLAPLLTDSGEFEAAVEMEDWLAAHHGSRGHRDVAAGHATRAGVLWERLGQTQKARDAFKKALELRPNDDAATLGQARIWLALGDADRAMHLFDAISRKPATTAAQVRADAYVGMGQCRAARQQRDQARACYDRALMLVPGHVGAIEAIAAL